MSMMDKQIGLGTFPFSNVFSPMTQKDAEDVVKEFVTLGGHYIETAPSYPVNEVALSDIIKMFNRDDIYIGSKCVLGKDENGQNYTSGKPEEIRKQCIRELKRLQVEYLDLLEAHITPTDVDPAITMEALNELKKEGIVRYIGVSNATISDLKSYIKGGHFDFVQNRYSIIYRSPSENIMSFCEANNIHMNPYQVIERGQLVDITDKAGEWREGDLRAKKAEYVGDAYVRVHQWVVARLAAIAVNAGLTMEELSIRWVLSKKQISIPVIGATKTWQVKNNIMAGAKELSAEVVNDVDEAYFDFQNEIENLFGLSIEEFRGLV